MTIYISTNVFIPTSFENVFTLLSKLEDPYAVGIEVFPNWKDEKFVKAIETNLEELKKYKTTVHGPYFNIEHSAAKGSDEYEFAMEEVLLTATLAKEIGAKDFVYHHNNKVITDENKAETIRESAVNLQELTQLLASYDVQLLIENAGVKSRSNMLFDQDEFIEMALIEENNVLIDIGHMHANGWDFEKVMEKLADKIVSYHLHNNDGYQDSHDRIHEGTLDFDLFEKLYKRYTPEAELVLEYGYDLSGSLGEMAEDLKELIGRFE